MQKKKNIFKRNTTENTQEMSITLKRSATNTWKGHYIFYNRQMLETTINLRT